MGIKLSANYNKCIYQKGKIKMYIVNPFYVYLIGTLPRIGLYLGIVGGCLCASGVFFLLCTLENSEKRIRKIGTTLLIIGLVFVLMNTFIPDKTTMTSILVAKCLTVENVQALGNTGKDIVDYMFDKIEELQKEK